MMKCLSVLSALTVWLAIASVSVSAQSDTPDPGYQDDRSTAESVIGSYYDAVNRRQYSRAYSYWEPASAASQLPPYAQFVQGYADTASVDLATGDVTSGVGAGQLYYSVPVTLVATMDDGSIQTFVGCYTLHIPRPEFQAVPPYISMGIRSATIEQVDNFADTAGLMNQSCPSV
jgi:hypothetical protein